MRESITRLIQNSTKTKGDVTELYGYNIPLNEFFRCALSVDCVIFGYSQKEFKVLLIKRGIEPFKDQWALPGDLMYPYENLNEAAQRVLQSLTGLKNIFMEQLNTFGKVDRHPAGRVVTVSYFALINIESFNPEASSWASKLEWHSIHKVPKLAFDHNGILKSSIESLRKELRTRPIGFNLLPSKFTLSDIQDLYESLLGKKFDKANFRKKLLATQVLRPLDETRRNVSHRPAKLYELEEGRLESELFQI